MSIDHHTEVLQINKNVIKLRVTKNALISARPYS
jgi:hypothetical protein